jgi:SanA protein
LKTFIKQSIKTWFFAGISALVIREIILLLNRRSMSLSFAVITLIEGAVLFIFWRFIFRLTIFLTTESSSPRIKKISRFCLLGFSVTFALITLPYIFVQYNFTKDIYSIANVTDHQAALVLGAGVWPNGTPSKVTVDRVKRAADLFHSGKVETVVLSGDEPSASAMYDLALNYDIPEDVITVDNEGLRTYDSCYNLKNIYKIKNAMIVTQEYHLPRALYICHTMGIDVVGVASDPGTSSPSIAISWKIREIPSTILAWLDLNIRKPIP